MSKQKSEHRSTLDEEDGTFDDVEAAMSGVNMLLNNGFDEALCLFKKYKGESPLMHAGYSFVYFMQALMSFEEDKVGHALKALQETERRCHSSHAFIRAVRSKFSRRRRSPEVVSTEDRLQRQVIVGDCLLFQAILVFTKQDMASYVRAGWLLRQAWKIYDKLHTQISGLKEALSLHAISSGSAPPHQQPAPTSTPPAAAAACGGSPVEEKLSQECMYQRASSPAQSSLSTTNHRSSQSSLTPTVDEGVDPQSSQSSALLVNVKASHSSGISRASSQSSVLVKANEETSTISRASSQSTLSTRTDKKTKKKNKRMWTAEELSGLTEETVDRLLGAVSLGYGVFQLCMSMVPPNILRLIQFLGFQGDRQLGLACLACTSHSADMKAPLATLGLLWYHTVLRPFFAIEASTGEPDSRQTGTSEAEAIIREKEANFPNSSLFFFFRGRIHRLKKEADQSYEMYMRAYQEAHGQREIELMCLYEISWYNLLKLNWDKAAEGFQRLRRDSKWSKSYYSYLVAVCLGAQGKEEEASAVFHEVPVLVKRKNNQIEMFVAHRAEDIRRVKVTRAHCQLLALELIFLWSSLSVCSTECVYHFIHVCEMQTEPSVFHLKCLLEGALYRQVDQEEAAVQSLKECVARQAGRREDAHVTAFALYELASIYHTNPSTQALAKEHLQHIKDRYKDYDFENRLSVRVNNLLRKLKRDSHSSAH